MTTDPVAVQIGNVGAAGPAPVNRGRPREIEELLNHHVVHPLSRAVAGLLIPTGISPNIVSIMGLGSMCAASACYLLLPWPWAAFAGLVFHFGWHVLDGADGDLARRTGRSSPNGEIVDGVCDHLSHLVLYVTLAVVLSREIGAWAWPLAVLAGISRGLQSSSYENARRTYRRWVHGVNWIKQDIGAARDQARPGLWKSLSTGAAGFYLRASGLVSADDRQVDAVMSRLTAAGGARAEAARTLYQQRQRPMVKRASVLSTNYETMAVFLSLMAGSPLWFFLVQATLLNLTMAALVVVQTRGYRRLAADLAALGPG